MAWIQAWIQAWSRSAFWLAIDVAASPKKIYAVHVDHLNRPVMLTDTAKVNVWAASFEPFGKVRTVTGAVTQNLGLPGQWFQLEHGLAYNWHRHYDPTTGRYTTADPLGFVDGPSVFAYAGSAPHTKVDPTGQFLWAPALAVAAVAILTPSNTFSPGNDLQPYINAAMVGGGFALQACVRGAYALSKGAASATNAANLSKQLSSQEGMLELLSGGGKAIAGAGAHVPLRDVGRLVSQYGGKAGDWAKVTSSAPGHMQTHAYRNVVTGRVVELKSIVP